MRGLSSDVKLGYRSGNRHFDDIDDLNRAINTAIGTFSSDAKIALVNFVRTGGFPRDTGRMIESAVFHIRISPIGPNFNLDIFFDTDYAELVNESEKHKDFLDKRRPEIDDIITKELRKAFDQEGLETLIS